jgi:hypothetical protein
MEMAKSSLPTCIITGVFLMMENPVGKTKHQPA